MSCRLSPRMVKIMNRDVRGYVSHILSRWQPLRAVGVSELDYTFFFYLLKVNFMLFFSYKRIVFQPFITVILDMKGNFQGDTLP